MKPNEIIAYVMSNLHLSEAEAKALIRFILLHDLEECNHHDNFHTDCQYCVWRMRKMADVYKDYGEKPPEHPLFEGNSP